jgi:STAM-binding protein
MASSYAADIPTQVSQFRPATFQPGPAGPYRNPSSAPPNVVGASSTSRPRSIAEMAEMAKDSLGDGDFPFKTWLRIAENARRSAKTYREQDELESAFVEYAKAAIISLEKIPGHPDYTIRLNSTQRHDMNFVS